MKRKAVLWLGCICLSLLFSGCSGSETPANKKTTEKISEKVTEKETEKETKKETEAVSENATDKKTAVGLGNLTSSGSSSGKAASGQTQPTQTEAAAQTQPVQTEAAAQAQEPQTEHWEVETSPRVYAEEYMQCPYCAHWFSTLPDGDLWNPYDRHMMEERDKDVSQGMTEEELVQCENCGNWYPAGNVFRNHICEGAQ